MDTKTYTLEIITATADETRKLKPLLAQRGLQLTALSAANTAVIHPLGSSPTPTVETGRYTYVSPDRPIITIIGSVVRALSQHDLDQLIQSQGLTPT